MYFFNLKTAFKLGNLRFSMLTIVQNKRKNIRLAINPDLTWSILERTELSYLRRYLRSYILMSFIIILFDTQLPFTEPPFSTMTSLNFQSPSTHPLP